jgi:23S rRNA (adenine2503-C2)-methyltransferase
MTVRNFQKTDIMNYSLDALTKRLGEMNVAPFRAKQILRWIYARQADEFMEMTDLKGELRERLTKIFEIPRLKKEDIQTAEDGTKKYLFSLADGNRIESVLIPEKDYFTLCVSSQVGCALGCRFCRTGEDGFTRNLTSGEILAQVRDALADFRIVSSGERPPDRKLTNIVFMGMGEPLANYSAVVHAVSLLTNTEYGLGFSTRRVTVSTAGLVPQLHALGRDADVNLAVSLNAADEATRSRLMPINRRHPLKSLLASLASFPMKPRRRILIEYILLKNVNDTDADAEKLAALVAPLKAKVNLIPFNPHEQSLFSRSEEGRAVRFQEILLSRGITAIIRKSKGEDIAAACGQLRSRR